MNENSEFKKPLEYTTDELDQLKHRQLVFHIGGLHSPEDLDKVQGEIVRIRLASNPPNLPTDVEIRLNQFEKKWFSLFEIKRISE